MPNNEQVATRAPGEAPKPYPADLKGEPGGGGDNYRASPELKPINRSVGTVSDNEIGVVCREMPRFCDEEAFMFGKPNQLGKPGVSDLRPDGMHTDGTQPRHVRQVDTDRQSIYTEK